MYPKEFLFENKMFYFSLLVSGYENFMVKPYGESTNIAVFCASPDKLNYIARSRNFVYLIRRKNTLFSIWQPY